MIIFLSFIKENKIIIRQFGSFYHWLKKVRKLHNLRRNDIIFWNNLQQKYITFFVWSLCTCIHTQITIKPLKSCLFQSQTFFNYYQFFSGAFNLNFSNYDTTDLLGLLTSWDLFTIVRLFQFARVFFIELKIFFSHQFWKRGKIF